MIAKHRVIQVGLGPIGIDMARRAAARPHLEIVGAVDIDPDLVGRDLEDLVEGASVSGRVFGNPTEALENVEADVAIVTTLSDLDRVVPGCETLLRGGVAIVSTCEEMAYPWVTHPDLAARLDEAGKSGNVACLGTGINPGFVLDLLPLVLSGPIDRVDTVRAYRVVDAAKRRGPLQKKVGAGLTKDAFDAKVQAGGFGHRGFTESLHMICAALGVETAGATTFIRPVIAEEDVTTEFVTVLAGQVAGIHQGAEDREGRIILDLKMYVGAQDPKDRVDISGDPPIRVTVEGGYHGDVATCAITLNAIDRIRVAQPGLRTMLDLPAVHARVR
jgi:hypothetical protein